MDEAEACHDIAHLAHVELLTPKLEDSRRFFLDVMGMQETATAGDSVYLRGWDDYEHHTLKLTASRQPGIGHFAFRASSPAALRRRAKALEATGLGEGWRVGDIGHGPAYSARDPDGHRFEIYYEAQWYEATAATKPALKNQAARYASHGIGVRRLDHLNLLAQDIRGTRRFMETAVGLRTTEMIMLDSGIEAGIWLTATNKSYDIAYTHDHSGGRGRFHHVTYAVDSRELVLRAADICLEHGVHIETGPHKHAVQQTFFLYVYEPGGNRVEVCNAGARLILAPDWKTIVWTEAERAKGQAWGLKTISTFHTYGTPDFAPDEVLDSASIR